VADKELTARVPPDIFSFLSMEEHQLLISARKMEEEFGAISRIEGLYKAAMSWREVRENDYVIFQLLTFTHYHLLYTLACQMRCHLSEAFASTRAAIDATLIAAYIINDRAAQVAYAKRQEPFDNFMRHLGNMIKGGKPLPHRLMPTLINQQKLISTFAPHADIGSFVHRVRRSEEDGSPMIGLEYFQFARDDNERKIHTYTLLHTYVMVLDVFSDFLVSEQKAVPPVWVEQLRQLGAAMERRAVELRETVREAHKDDPNRGQVGAAVGKAQEADFADERGSEESSTPASAAPAPPKGRH
jgi:hypothetical protein